MLYTAILNIGSRKNYGSVYQRDLVLPARIKRIKGFFANVIPEQNSKLRLVSSSDGGDVKDAQIGVASLSINGNVVIASNIPLIVLDSIRNSSLSKNLVTLSQPVLIQNGSYLRIVVEEKMKCPFVNSSDDEANLSDYFENDEIPTNGYEVKIYIEYDQ